MTSLRQRMIILANSCRASTVQSAREALGAIGYAGADQDRGEACYDREDSPSGTTAPVACPQCGGAFAAYLPYPSRAPPSSAPRTTGCAAVKPAPYLDPDSADILPANRPAPPRAPPHAPHGPKNPFDLRLLDAKTRQLPQNSRLSRTTTDTPPVRSDDCLHILPT